jgi:polyisoprenoid-binding protein YceI
MNYRSFGGKTMTSANETDSDLFASAGSWTLQPSQTSVEFHTKAMWLLNVKGKFQAIEGSATVSADGSIGGSLVLDAASVDTNNKKRDAHLRTADFFETDAYPTITFTVTAARPQGPGKVELVGNLTIHGTTRPLTIPADVKVTGDSVVVSGKSDIDRSDWGLTWAKLGAGLKNRVVINATFNKI